MGPFEAQLQREHKQRQERFFPRPKVDRPAPKEPEPEPLELLPAYFDRLTPSKIIWAVARYYRFSTDDLRTRRRSFERLNLARSVACHATRKILGASYPFIGRLVDRDHSMVIIYERKIDALLESDLAFSTEISQLYDKIRGI